MSLTHSKSDKIPWNQGKLVGQKAPLKPQEVWAIRVRLELAKNRRDLALFNLAVDSKLRGCDLLRIRVSDMRTGGEIRRRAKILQSKTGNPVQFEVTKCTRNAIEDWCRFKKLQSHDWLFPSRKDRNRHLTTRQYARLVMRDWSNNGLDRLICHDHLTLRTLCDGLKLH